MKKRIVIIFLLAASVILPARGDDFEDFIQACARLSSNYNRAVQSPRTRMDREYRANLEQAQNLSRKVHLTIRRLELGEDFNFPALIEELSVSPS